jgi:hypothetical protein
LLERRRHQALQRALMVEQRVAAGQQGDVRFRLVQVQQQLHRFDAVDAQAPALDHAFVAQAVQRAEGAGAGASNCASHSSP